MSKALLHFTSKKDLLDWQVDSRELIGVYFNKQGQFSSPLSKEQIFDLYHKLVMVSMIGGYVRGWHKYKLIEIFLLNRDYISEKVKEKNLKDQEEMIEYFSTYPVPPFHKEKVRNVFNISSAKSNTEEELVDLDDISLLRKENQDLKKEIETLKEIIKGLSR